MSDSSNAVCVAVRVRDLPREAQSCVSVNTSTQLTIRDSNTEDDKVFSFDYVFNNSDTKSVYDPLGSKILKNVFDGYNSCLFAYGQTGSGKTHTLLGDSHEHGIIPLFCDDLFKKIDREAKEQKKYDILLHSEVEVEYMEIYAEKVRDLLDTSKGINNVHKDLKVREHPRRGPYVEGLQRVAVKSSEHTQKLMEAGNKERTTASTNANSVSSRSHGVFIITLHLTYLQNDGTSQRHVVSSKLSTINLIDLAGSERVKHSGVEGKHLKEAAFINQSLSALGSVISDLAECKSDLHIPYRNSKLTWLLKESLGGNSKTIMIATLTPNAEHYFESLSTLRYASKCKKIINKAIINEDPNALKIKQLQTEIEELKSQLKLYGNGSTNISSDEIMFIQKSLELNHELMDKFQLMFDDCNNEEKTKLQVEQLELQLKMMEEQPGFDINSKEYQDLQSLITQVRDREEKEQMQINEHQGMLFELEQQKRAVDEKQAEIELAQREIEQHKLESNQVLEKANNQIQKSHARQENQKLVNSQREIVLQRIVKHNEEQKTKMTRELESLESEISLLTSKKQRLTQMKSQKDEVGLPTPRQGNKVTKDISVKDLKNVIDKYGPPPKQGTQQYEWECKAITKYVEKGNDLRKYEALLTSKEKEIIELRNQLSQQIEQRKQGKVEMERSLDTISPSKYRSAMETHRSSSRDSPRKNQRSSRQEHMRSHSQPLPSSSAGPSTSRSFDVSTTTVGAKQKKTPFWKKVFGKK